jgi:DNA-directed RNA polymerase subunit M/transcription elongation factor TFIIS
MKFCKQCGSAMTKTTTMKGSILFICRCQLHEEGNDDDTLMAEGSFTTNDNQYIIFLEQASSDPAANRVLVDCPRCGIDFMTKVQVGASLTTMYACDPSCGYRGTYENYTKEIDTLRARPKKT